MRASLLLLGLLLAGAYACAPRPEPAEEPNGPLLASLQATTRAGGAHFVLQVTNTTDSVVELTFPSSQSFDFSVMQDGRTLWTWSADRSFAQMMRSERVAPGETLSYDAGWTPAAPVEGELTVVGRLTALEHPVQQSARFRLR